MRVDEKQLVEIEGFISYAVSQGKKKKNHLLDWLDGLCKLCREQTAEIKGLKDRIEGESDGFHEVLHQRDGGIKQLRERIVRIREKAARLLDYLRIFGTGNPNECEALTDHCSALSGAIHNWEEKKVE